MADQKDLVIIGGGPGGYVAAIRAAQLGLSTAVVEKDDRFGGTCLLRGCIPTKAILHSAALFDQMQKADSFGLAVKDAKVEMKKVLEYKSKMVDKNAKGIDFLFKKNKVEPIHGRGRLKGRNRVEVEGKDGKKQTLEAKHIIVATGSVPRELKGAETDGKTILNSDHILELDRIPKSIAVLGAGAVGTEFASIYASFGSEVTLIEMLPRVLPIEDEEVSKELEKQLKRRGMEILTGAKVSKVEKAKGGVELHFEGGKETLKAELLLVAIGRPPVTKDLGLEDAGVELDDKGFIRVNGYMQTSASNVYAIGDVVDTPWLAHVASAEGIVAAEHMAGREARPLDYDNVPSVTFCEPEVASVGLTEAEAKERGYDVETGKFPFTALGKAGILGKTEGFVKVVRETKYDELLGVHIIGAHATDLIAEAGVALQLESTTEELFRAVHAHPTMSEALAEAAHAAHGHAIHF